MKIAYTFALALALASPGAKTQAGESCVLPPPDGADVIPSPPSLLGTIEALKGNSVSIRIEGLSQPYRVLLNRHTSMFTVYGGGIGLTDLRVGQHAIVWLKGCAKPGSAVHKAAVFQICSLASEPCPD